MKHTTASGERIMPMPDPEKKRKTPKVRKTGPGSPTIQVPKVTRRALSELLVELNRVGERLDRRRRLIESEVDSGPIAFRRRFRFFEADVVHTQTAILMAVSALLQVQINIKEQFNED